MHALRLVSLNTKAAEAVLPSIPSGTVTQMSVGRGCAFSGRNTLNNPEDWKMLNEIIITIIVPCLNLFSSPLRLTREAPQKRRESEKFILFISIYTFRYDFWGNGLCCLANCWGRDEVARSLFDILTQATSWICARTQHKSTCITTMWRAWRKQQFCIWHIEVEWFE